MASERPSRESILSEPAGPQMDAWVAEFCLGWVHLSREGRESGLRIGYVGLVSLDGLRENLMRPGRDPHMPVRGFAPERHPESIRLSNHQRLLYTLSQTRLESSRRRTSYQQGNINSVSVENVYLDKIQARAVLQALGRDEVTA